MAWLEHCQCAQTSAQIFGKNGTSMRVPLRILRVWHWRWSADSTHSSSSLQGSSQWLTKDLQKSSQSHLGSTPSNLLLIKSKFLRLSVLDLGWHYCKVWRILSAFKNLHPNLCFLLGHSIITPQRQLPGCPPPTSCRCVDCTWSSLRS